MPSPKKYARAPVGKGCDLIFLYIVHVFFKKYYFLDKTKKLKQAKEEAAADIEQYRNECEAKFREKQKNVCIVQENR